MRTTVTLADDVAAELERLRRVEGLGPSEAINMLVRRGMATAPRARVDYAHRAAHLGLKVDVTNISDVLDLLDSEDDDAREDAR